MSGITICGDWYFAQIIEKVPAYQRRKGNPDREAVWEAGKFEQDGTTYLRQSKHPDVQPEPIPELCGVCKGTGTYQFELETKRCPFCDQTEL